MSDFIFVVGAPKSGTFYLHELFNSSADITVSKMKEPNYFVNAVFNAEGMKYCKSEEEYFLQYSENDSNFFSDCSPSYLRCKESPALIKDFCRKHNFNPKIIIMLREPVSRAYSNWKMDVRQGHQKMEFLEALFNDHSSNDSKMHIQYEYFKSGNYYSQVKAYLDVFGTENVLINISERTKGNKSLFVENVSNFLGIKLDTLEVDTNQDVEPKNFLIKELYYSKLFRRLQRAILSDSHKEFLRSKLFKAAKSKPLSELEREKAKELFKEDVARLKELIGDSLAEWMYE